MRATLGKRWRKALGGSANMCFHVESLHDIQYAHAFCWSCLVNGEESRMFFPLRKRVYERDRATENSCEGRTSESTASSNLSF